MNISDEQIAQLRELALQTLIAADGYSNDDEIQSLQKFRDETMTILDIRSLPLTESETDR